MTRLDHLIRCLNANPYLRRSIPFLLFSLLVWPRCSWSQEVPNAAFEAAHKYLDYWKSVAAADPDFFKGSWGLDDIEDISSAQLGYPYAAYVVRRESLLVYGRSKDSDLLRYADLRFYGFPVLYKGRFVISLEIYSNIDREGKKFRAEDGEYTGAGLGGPDQAIERGVLKLRSKYPRLKDSVISYLATSGFGHYFIVSWEEGSASITPFDEESAKILSLDHGRSGTYPLIPMDEGLAVVKKKVQEYVKSYEESLKWREMLQRMR